MLKVGFWVLQHQAIDAVFFLKYMILSLYNGTRRGNGPRNGFDIMQFLPEHDERNHYQYAILIFDRSYSNEKFYPKNLTKRITTSLLRFTQDLLDKKVVFKEKTAFYQYYYALINDYTPSDLYDRIKCILDRIDHLYNSYIDHLDYKYLDSPYTSMYSNEKKYYKSNKDSEHGVLYIPLFHQDREVILLNSILTLYYITCIALESGLFDMTMKYDSKYESLDHENLMQWGELNTSISAYQYFERNYDNILNLGFKGDIEEYLSNGYRSNHDVLFNHHYYTICPYTGNFNYMKLNTPDLFGEILRNNVFDNGIILNENYYSNIHKHSQSIPNIVLNSDITTAYVLIHGLYTKDMDISNYITKFKEFYINEALSKPDMKFEISVKELHNQLDLEFHISLEDFTNIFFLNGIIDFPFNVIAKIMVDTNRVSFYKDIQSVFSTKLKIPLDKYLETFYEKCEIKKSKRKSSFNGSGKVPVDPKFAKKLVTQGLPY